MSLAAISSFELFVKSTWSQEAEMNLTAISSQESTRKHFSRARRTSCLESRNQTLLGSQGRNESNSHQLGRIGKKKIFHECDAQHV